ncbi:MAG TPA: CBS domain-containing protein [Anaerolineales bacterium]|nr:CBS domain-containing protein [Anaerolineales bacterium]
MTVGVATCSPDTPVAELARLILERGMEDLVVLEDGHALGVVGQDDLVRAYASGNGASLTAREVMREGVPQVPPDIPLEVAAQIMRDLKVRSLFLMHHAGGIEYPAAVITYRHLLRHLAAREVAELVDLGIKASRQLPLDTFAEKREAAQKRVGRVSRSGDQV